MDIQQNFWHLENLDVTNLLCPQKLGEAKNNLKHKIFEKGEYIFLSGDDADKIFFIYEGRVKIGTYSPSGKEITKAIMTRGEIFGEMSIAGEEVRRNFAMAMEKTIACMLSIEQMKDLMRDHSALSLFFMKMMGSRMLEMEKRLESLVFKDSRTRVVEYLKDLCAKKGQRVGYEWVIRNILTHQEIANLTATSRQTVTTVLNDLEGKNILTYNRRRLLIRDLEGLNNEAKPA